MFLAHKAIIQCFPLGNTVKFNLTLIPQKGISELVLVSLFSVFMYVNNCPWDAAWL